MILLVRCSIETILAEDKLSSGLCSRIIRYNRERQDYIYIYIHNSQIMVATSDRTSILQKRLIGRKNGIESITGAIRGHDVGI